MTRREKAIDFLMGNVDEEMSDVLCSSCIDDVGSCPCDGDFTDTHCRRQERFRKLWEIEEKIRFMLDEV